MSLAERRLLKDMLDCASMDLFYSHFLVFLRLKFHFLHFRSRYLRCAFLYVFSVNVLHEQNFRALSRSPVWNLSSFIVFVFVHPCVYMRVHTSLYMFACACFCTQT